MTLKTMGGPGVGGLHPAPIIVDVYCDEALTKFDLCMFDFVGVDALTTNGTPGSVNSALYHVRIVDADSGGARPTHGYVLGVAQTTMAADETGKVMVKGITQINAPAAVIEGDCVCAAAAIECLEATGNLGTKIIGIVLSDYESVSSTATVWFNGVEGFGIDSQPNS